MTIGAGRSKVAGNIVSSGRKRRAIHTIEEHLLPRIYVRQMNGSRIGPTLCAGSLRNRKSGTQIHLTHDKFPYKQERDSHDEGWDLYFLEPMQDC